MQERNEYLESDGLHWESDTHEWFHDKISTNYARTDSGLNKDALKNVYCFITRNKQTGEYDRVMMDSDTNQVIYDTKSLEELSYKIDQMKIAKRFNI